MTITIEWWHVLLAVVSCAVFGFGVYGWALWYVLVRGLGR